MTMSKVLIVGNEAERMEGLRRALAQRGFACSVAPDDEGLLERVAKQAPDLVLVAMNGFTGDPSIRQLAESKPFVDVSTIVLLPRQALDDPGAVLDADDFVVEPWDASEVALRARRVLQRSNGTDGEEVIECGDLLIDPVRYEVRLRGEIVTLTFREYELLKLLASNKGRVFTRDALLNRVWGYDYYGGDRTVDVHIRRLRSKIEGSGDSFIETVRYIGYKFRST
jgi:DNA-binding response OmpR family regulator